MAGDVSVAHGALKAAAIVVGQSRDELTGELHSLEEEISGISGSWQGQGAAAFQQWMNSWREDTTKLLDALNEFEANLQASEVSYTAADDAQASAMSWLNNRLGPR